MVLQRIMRTLLILFALLISVSLDAQINALMKRSVFSGLTDPRTIDSLDVWFRATDALDSLGNPATNNKGVHTLTDLSGNGHNATAVGGAGKAPVWKSTDGVSGKPTMQFDGTNDYLATSAYFWGSDDITIFVVMKFGNPTRDAAEMIVSKNEATGNTRQFQYYGQNVAGGLRGQLQVSADGVAITVFGFTANNWKKGNYAVHTVTSNATTATFYRFGNNVDGADVSVGNIFNSSVPRLSIGANNVINSPSSFLQGNISEIIIYRRGLTAAEIAAVEEYLYYQYYPSTLPSQVDSLFYHFDANQGALDSLGAPAINNKGVWSWADLSGRNYYVTAAGGSGTAPVFKTGALAGYPGIQFDGSNDFLASVAHFWGSDDITVIVAIKFVDAGRDVNESIIGKYETTAPEADHRQWIVSGANDAGENRVRIGGSNNGTAAQFWQKSYPVKSTAWKLHAYVDDNSSFAWYEDGSSITIDASTTNGTKSAIADFNTVKLGIGAGTVTVTPSGFFQGTIAEIIVYSKALSTTERTAIEYYLMHKYRL